MKTQIGKWAILGAFLAVLFAAGCSAEATPPNQNVEPESGVVSGRIQAPLAGMPADDLPALRLFFENTATEEVVVVPIAAGQRDYRASLPPGTYYVYTWLPDFSRKGAYTICQSGSPCQEHTLRPFAVTSGRETAGIDVAGWHAPSDPPIVLVGTVIDGTGAEPLADAAVVIQGSRIVAVGPTAGIDIPTQGMIFDLPDATILPGLINSHVHNAYEPRNLSAWLQQGVTTVRDLGAPLGSSYFSRRDELRSNPGYARVVASGPIVTVPGGYPTSRISCLTVSSPEDAQQKITQLLAGGADVIKIAIESGGGPTLSAAEISAIVETAHESNIPVTAHVTKSQDLERALAAGVDDIAHMVTDRASRSIIRQMVESETSWVPTLVALDGEGAGNLQQFVRAGGSVALGSDAGYLPGLKIGLPMDEIMAMQGAGMTPMEVLVASTRNAARVCRLEGVLGTLEVGKLADILVVGGNPLEDIRALEQVRLVIHDGSIIQSDGAEPGMTEGD
jgi:imidazolonepropionase-like amidohydrolase